MNCDITDNDETRSIDKKICHMSTEKKKRMKTDNEVIVDKSEALKKLNEKNTNKYLRNKRGSLEHNTHD